MSSPVPVVVFAYARPDHLRRLLACLRADEIPLLYAFSDGPKTPDVDGRVAEVRSLLHAIDWCEVNVVERTANLGLGRSILTGVNEVFQKHDAILVFEDDMLFVPGTYRYLCAALEHYRDDPRVMSVTGWTHPLIKPDDLSDQPYFDGRSECLSWGTWARVWRDIPMDPRGLVAEAKRQGRDIYRYGADLVNYVRRDPQMKVSWDMPMFFYHILHAGLCLRPPWSMVQHAGWDSMGTNAHVAGKWADPPLDPCPPVPTDWPVPQENPACAELWQKQYGGKPSLLTRIKDLLTPAYARLLRTRAGPFFNQLVKVAKKGLRLR